MTSKQRNNVHLKDKFTYHFKHLRKSKENTFPQLKKEKNSYIYNIYFLTQIK